MENKDEKKRSNQASDGSLSIEAYLLGLLSEIHDRDADHPMFGVIEDGKVRAPFEAKPGDRSNTVTWKKIIMSFANQLKVNGVTRIGSNCCWMVKATQIKLTRQVEKRTKLCKSILWTRFLHFLKSPTDNNWQCK